VSVLVVGDTLLDVDVSGRVERTAPDCGAAVLDVEGETDRPGGAGLAAVLLAGEGVATTLVTALAPDAAGARLHTLLAQHVELLAGPAEGATVVKRRLSGPEGTLLRVDSGDARPAPGFDAALAGPLAAHRAGAVLVSDYGRGVAGQPVVRAAVRAALRSGCPVVWDPHPRGPAPVPGVSVVTPNLAEARGVAGDGSPNVLAARVRTSWRCDAVVVTLGGQGALLATAGGRACTLPAPAGCAGDPCGAGDRFAGALAAALAEGVGLEDATRGAVDAASRFVRDGGAGGWALGARAGEGRPVGDAPGETGVGAGTAGP